MAGGEAVTTAVVHGGPGFDPDALTAPADDLPEHGLGLALARVLKAEVEVGTRDGGGCRVRPVKRCSVR